MHLNALYRSLQRRGFTPSRPVLTVAEFRGVGFGSTRPGSGTHESGLRDMDRDGQGQFGKGKGWAGGGRKGQFGRWVNQVTNSLGKNRSFTRSLPIRFSSLMPFLKKNFPLSGAEGNVSLLSKWLPLLPCFNREVS